MIFSRIFVIKRYINKNVKRINKKFVKYLFKY